MEITRQRVRPEMDIKTAEKCPCCKGTGKIGASISLSDEIENTIKYILKKHKSKNVVLKTHPFVHAYLTKGVLKSLRKSWQKKYQCKLSVSPMMAYSYMEFHFFNAKDEEIFY